MSDVKDKLKNKIDDAAGATKKLVDKVADQSKKAAHKDSKAANDALPATFSLIDRSARWGIIKKNTAARYKSRLQARLKAIA